MKISYYLNIHAERNFVTTVEFLARLPGIKTICEIGGGANPLLGLDFIRENSLTYTILDISQEELDKASDEYNKICADITDESLALNCCFDLVFSRMVLEHIQCASKFHENVYRMLSETGIAFHLFPTLYSLPFFVNKLLPDRMLEIILEMVAPRDKYRQAKFRAYYNWCYGPTQKNIHRFKVLGYEIQHYVGYFGHDYYNKFKPIRWLHRNKSSQLLKFPNPNLTSYSYLLLSKSPNTPLAGQDEALHQIWLT
jgi:2-polyprenyl-3-methyl-5-hydroxy-6-metoxy-1,4-benzoquinol methylase